MQGKKSVRKDGKMIHVRLDEKLHKKLRIYIANNDFTIQDYISELIHKELNKKKA